MIAIGTTPLTPLAVASRLNPQSDGTYTVSYANGSVMSVQKNGSIETRPAGTAGAFEKCLLVGDMLIFNPQVGDNIAHPYCFAYVGSLPNAQ